MVLAIGDAGVNGKDATVSTIEQIHGDQGKANLTLQDYKDHQDATGRGRFSMAALGEFTAECTHRRTSNITGWISCKR